MLDDEFKITLKEALFLRDALRALAQDNYNEHFQREGINAQREDFTSDPLGLLRYVDNAERRESIRECLKALNFNDFFKIANGSSATVLFARHVSDNIFAVRVPDERCDPDYHDRLSVGPVLQPLYTLIDPLGYPLEIQPLGLVLEGADIENIDIIVKNDSGWVVIDSLDLLRNFYSALGYHIDRVKDVFILPNGVPVFADPDICQSDDNAVSENQVHKRIMELYGADVGLVLCDLAWVDENGQRWQDKFWPPNSLASPVRLANAAKPAADGEPQP